MARIEDLIADIEDLELQAEVAEEVRQLKAQTTFGLVYERHIPESVLLRSRAGVTVGDEVRLRLEPNDPTAYTVVSVTRKTATIEHEARSVTVSIEDLLVVKGLGEPVFPTLTSVGSVERGGDKPPHLLIEGENFHALELLTYTHRGKADCVYLDPPYNTGARDWKYNNDYVDSGDAWRHSKWLSFMEKRLTLAKQLLRPDGVLIVTIDEFELYHLGMLLERLFPDYLVYKVSDVTNPKGSTGTRNFGVVDEQVLFCVPAIGRNVISEIPVVAVEGEVEWEYQHARRRGGATSYRHQRPKQFYPLFIDEDAGRVVRAGAPIPLEALPDFSPVDGLRPIWPIDSHGLDRCWRFSPTSMQREIDSGNAVLGQHNAKTDTWTINIRRPKRTTRKLKSVWWETSHDAGTHGTELLRGFLGQPGLFPFPKSLYSVRDALAAVVLDRPEALIVDVFAGSGTTLHATMLLNAEDDGQRQCVLVTNNEVEEAVAKQLNKRGVFRGDSDFEMRGIFQAVTRPRCEAAVKGKTPAGVPLGGKYIDGRPWSEGFAENLQFMRLDYLDPNRVELGMEYKALAPVVWLLAGARGHVPDNLKSANGYLVAEENRFAVLFDETSFGQLIEDIAESPQVDVLFLLTSSEDAFAEMSAAVPGRATFMLPRDYLRYFRAVPGARA